MAVQQKFDPQSYSEIMVLVKEGWKVTLIFADETKEVCIGPETKWFYGFVTMVIAEEEKRQSVGNQDMAVIFSLREIDFLRMWAVLGDYSQVRLDIDKRGRNHF